MSRKDPISPSRELLVILLPICYDLSGDTRVNGRLSHRRRDYMNEAGVERGRNDIFFSEFKLLLLVDLED